MIEVSYGVAMIAGMLSFVSPCVLPIVPASLAFLSGETFEQVIENKKNQKNNIIKYSIFFVLGFSTIFVALGAGASFLGSLLLQYSRYFTVVAGVVLIIIGANMAGFISLKMFNYQWVIDYRNIQKNNNNRLFSSYLIGMAFGFGWTPCIGPVLGAILTFTANYQTINEGIILLAAYSAGLGIPFIIAAVFFEKFIKKTQKLKPNLGKIRNFMAFTLIITGILFVTDNIATLANWIAGILPATIQYT